MDQRGSDRVPDGASSRLTLSRSIRKMVAGIAIFGAVCVIAIVGYLIAGWALDDAIYMVILTIFGVGGADKVVLPTAIGATRMSQLILHPSADELLDRLTGGGGVDGAAGAGGFDLDHIGLAPDELVVDADSPLANRTLAEIEAKGAHTYLVVGVRHADGTTVLNPRRTPSWPSATPWSCSATATTSPRSPPASPAPPGRSPTAA